MDQNHAVAITRTVKSWINPPHPGRNRSPAVGLLMGFLLGPLGVAIHLRSLVQGGLCLVATVMVMLLTGLGAEWTSNIIAAIWVVGRILWDNQPPATPKPDTASPSSMPPIDKGAGQAAVAMA